MIGIQHVKIRRHQMIIAIDPGKTGSIAIGSTYNDTRVLPMPSTEADIVHLLTELTKYIDVVYIEDVHAMPKQGVVSMFTFGRNYGLLRGILQCLRVPMVEVSPAKWIRTLGLTGKGKN